MKIIDTIAEDTQKIVGRCFEHEDELVGITRRSSDLLKGTYRDDVSMEDWKLLVKFFFNFTSKFSNFLKASRDITGITGVVHRTLDIGLAVQVCIAVRSSAPVRIGIDVSWKGRELQNECYFCNAAPGDLMKVVASCFS